MAHKVMDPDSLNANVKKTVYAVRGELYLRASELQKEGKKIIFTNVGNPHALGQKPLTFPRQVMALCQAPFLMDDPHVGLLFPSDAIARAKKYLAMNTGGVGAYSDSRGVPGVRQEVADFILERDGHPRYTYICCSHRFIVVGLWSLSPEMLASILTLIS
jgi:glutamate--glyoxylate aminotransferase